MAARKASANVDGVNALEQCVNPAALMPFRNAASVRNDCRSCCAMARVFKAVNVDGKHHDGAAQCVFRVVHSCHQTDLINPTARRLDDSTNVNGDSREGASG